jgi:cytoskeleton protein RodZ
LKTDHVDMMPDDEIVPPLAPGPSSAALAGELLRRGREAAGLHIATLAVSLKIPIKKLEALEAGRLDQLPDAVFVRALASSVCRTLKMDPGPVLAQLPQNSGPRLAHDENGINAPFRSPDDNAGTSWMTQLSRPAILLGLAFLLAALVLIFLPRMSAVSNDSSVQKTLEPALPAPEDAAPVPAVASNDGPAPAEAVEGASRSRSTVKPVAAPEAPLANTKPVSPAPVIAPSPPALQAPPQAAATPAARNVTVAGPSAVVAPAPARGAASATQTSASAVAPAASAPAAAMPSSGIVSFKANAESWVEVTDAKGQATLRRLLQAGETANASGTLPLVVIVGRANATTVLVRGRPFDLQPLARDNVARFEVK